MEYLHSHNVIHGDIKCANVLINKEGQIKLTDFGTAQVIKKSSKEYMGTCGFMAPEILKGESYN